MEIETTPPLLDAVDTARIFWIPASRFAFDRSRKTVTELLQRRDRKHHTVLDLDWRPMFWDSEEQAHAAISPMLDHVTIAIGNRTASSRAGRCPTPFGTATPQAPSSPAA
jgi:5-dehydro-2-deoxygluconokinase